VRSAESATTAPRARLEIVSDVVCPWCYIGKHRLDQALAQIGADIEFDISWRPFELNPTMALEGMDRKAYVAAKFGSADHARQIYANVTANADSDGLPIAIERIARTPNTRAAHRLIDGAGKLGCQNAVVDALFKAYFVDGQDIGDLQVLHDLGVAAGLDADAIASALADATGAGDARIDAEEAVAHELGIHGVPAFIYNGRMLLSGAQSPQTIALSLKRASAKGL
jgi:predicted DsbA family dithiol-disulfide isomerase